MIADLLLSDSLFFLDFLNIGSCNAYWKAEPQLGVVKRIQIVQDFNDALLVRPKLGRGGCLFASFSHLLDRPQGSSAGILSQTETNTFLVNFWLWLCL